MSEDTALLLQRIRDLEVELAERRRSEDLQRALYEIASLSAADSPQHEHYVQLHAIVGRLMYARNFIIATYDADEGMIRQQYLVDEDPNEVLTQPLPVPAAPAPSPRAEQQGTEAEMEFWREVKDTDDPEELELYVEQFPRGVYVELAQRKMAKLRGEAE